MKVGRQAETCTCVHAWKGREVLLQLLYSDVEHVSWLCACCHYIRRKAVLLVLTCGAKGQIRCLEAWPGRLCARLSKDSLVLVWWMCAEASAGAEMQSLELLSTKYVKYLGGGLGNVTDCYAWGSG